MRDAVSERLQAVTPRVIAVAITIMMPRMSSTTTISISVNPDAEMGTRARASHGLVDGAPCGPGD